MEDVVFACVRCGKERPGREAAWRCDCGGTLRVVGHELPPDTSGRGIWRWLRGLPVDEGAIVSLGEGETPLIRRRVGGGEAWLKMDHLQPTGSYKDRGMAALVSWLRTVGVSRVTEDSSGNAGSSMAAYCAAGGVSCDVYVPAYTSEGKCVQIRAYGAGLVRVPGTREDGTRAAMEAAGAPGAFYASHNWSPVFLEGVGTWALETLEALPSTTDLVVPVGQGSIALGASVAIEKLRRAGRLATGPRIFAVQPEVCAPLARAFEAGLDGPVAIEKGETAAEGIASAEPVRGAEVLRAVRASGGGFVTVDEEEIWAAHGELCRAGIYVEPTSATVVAGWRKLREAGRVAPDGTVLYLSGIGLKATDKIQAHMSC